MGGWGLGGFSEAVGWDGGKDDVGKGRTEGGG